MNFNEYTFCLQGSKPNTVNLTFVFQVQKKTNQTSKKIEPLTTVLAYSNNRVVNRFMKEFGTSKNEAQNIFQDLLRWLWINALHTIEVNTEEAHCPRYLGIRVEQVVVDEMWHIFLLYTSDYRDFCNTYFGFFIDHSPNDKTNEVISESALESHLLSFLSYIDKNLGRDTLLRWFDDYAEEYSAERLYLNRNYSLQKKSQHHAQ